MTAAHPSPLGIVRAASIAFRPPRRLSVSEAAAENLVIRQPGGYSGPWSPTETPYMVEPMDMLASRKHEAVCFVGPARTGKTMGLLDGWMASRVTCDPGDMLIVQMSQDKARDYSKTRVDRGIRHSPALRELMSVRGHDDNTHDKLFRHGMWLKIGWPSATQLASSDYRYVALTDYDRFPDNIEGEGAAFPLALKRTQTYLSRGMCMVESSPGREVTDPNWRPETAHEAPPSTGILGIYNTTDRRRWYWECPDCRQYFEAKPGLELFGLLPPDDELEQLVRKENLESFADEHAKVVCPECGSVIDPKWKPHLNRIETARWVADGQRVVPGGEVVGEAPASSMAGYWLGGVAAAYQRWDSLLLRYLRGLREYVLTGAELILKSTTNTDQGMPYTPRHYLQDKEFGLEDRTEDLSRYLVPAEARFLIATVDVQGGSNGRFVVEVRAFGVNLEQWLVDRFSISQTERDGQAAQVDPAGYQEDWDLITQKVVTATYRTPLDKELRVYRVGVDTGGEDGTAQNAYSWYQRLRRAGLSSRVLLLKGRGGKSGQGEKPMVRGHARDSRGKAIRSQPVWQIDTNYYKDIVAASMRRKVPGAGYFHAPKWLANTYFDELRAEVRQPNGTWKKIRARNEALDLWVYALAICEALGFGARGTLKWEKPPEWALPLDANAEMITPEERRLEKKVAASGKPRRRQKIGKPGWGNRL